MSIDLKALRANGLPEESISWQYQDAALYALAVGMGRDSQREAELDFVADGRGLRVLPSFASALVPTRLPAEAGIEATQVRHLGENLLIHRALTENGSGRLAGRVVGAEPVPEGQTHLVNLDFDARDTRGELLFTLQRSLLVGEGEAAPDTLVDPAAEPLPARPPDLTSELVTRLDDGLLFRLIAPQGGAPVRAPAGRQRRPALPGLCTWGVACRAILATICEYDTTLVRSLAGRLVAPALPGDTLVTEMWQQANVVFFRTRAAGRDAVVLDQGRCELAA